MGKRAPLTCRADMRGLSDDIKLVLDKVLAAGWRAELTAGGHIRVFSPDKSVPPISTSQTPSDPRAWKNWRGQLRRAGLNV